MDFPPITPSFMSPSMVVGATPPLEARPVSLAVRNYLQRYFDRSHQVSGGSGIVLAVSGGADSLSLAVAAADVAERMQIPYTAAIVNHGLRKESEAEALEVEGQLYALGCPEVAVLQADTTGVDLEHPLEGWGREVRHQLLNKYALEWATKRGAGRPLGSVDILYGHTQDDQAETVLMRLGRGASPRSLAAMRERVVVATSGIDDEGGNDDERPTTTLHRGRPLLSVRRTDTVAFCRALGLTWVNDPSNSAEGAWTSASGAALPRTALRHDVLPRLGDALGQDPIPALARVAQLLAEDEDALSMLADDALDRVWEKGAEDNSIDVEAVADLPLALRKRVYLLVWGAVASSLEEPLHSAQLRSLDQLVINSSSGPRSPIGKIVSLPGGWTAKRSRKSLIFRKPKTLGVLTPADS
ncbi:MAG: tRNA lysidine(34) synthetase TilS [Actinomyces sp.]|nr:tRNA lysidine(34) synthetase TilS [Actinomyces sp.]